MLCIDAEAVAVVIRFVFTAHNAFLSGIGEANE
jgi:hypothetical protein